MANGDSGEGGEDACFHRGERDMRHGFFDTAGLAMQAQTKTTNIVPRWFGIQQSAIYSGVSARLVENRIRDGLVRSSNVLTPGSTRGRRLIDRESLDSFIEAGVANGPTKLAMNAGGEQ